MKRVLLLLVLVAVSLAGFAGGGDFEIGPAIDIPQNGRNKLLHVRNGNTLLFRFEDKKGLQVKVFDKSLKETVSVWHTGNSLDLRSSEQLYFDGLYEIGKEAVLFITRKSNNAESLYRIRFNTTDGSMAGEENLSRTAAFPGSTTAFVLKEYSDEVYYVLAFSKPDIQNASMYLHMYNEEHEQVRKIPIEMVKKGYDEIHLLSQQVDRSGAILLTAEITKSSSSPNPPEKYLVLYYLPKNAIKVNAQILKLPTGAKDFSINYVDNTYAETVNIFLSALVETPATEAGAEPSTFFYQMLFITDHELNVLSQVQLSNDKLLNAIKQQTGKETAYAGNILAAAPDNKGNTVVISEDLISANDNTGNNIVYSGITEYDHEGKEKHAIVLPLPLGNTAENTGEDFKTPANELSKTLSIITDKNTYVIYNDAADNFDKRLSDKFTSVGDRGKTNAVYYHIDNKGKVSKHYLLGQPEAEVYKRIHPIAGSFDRRKNVYTTIVSILNKNNITTHLARCKLND